MTHRHRQLLALLPHLGVLLAERHVSRAAERAGITQPSMSRVLASARSLFGDDLLLHSPRGGRLTPRGEELRAQIASILSLVESASSPSEFVPAQAQGILRVSATDYAAHVDLPALAARLRRHAPRMTLEVFPWTSDTLHRIERDEIQLGINPLTENAPRGFLRRRIARDQYVVALAAKHPFAARPRLDLRQFLAVPHVLTIPEGGQVGVVDHALRRRRKNRVIGARVKDFSTALALAGASDMLVTVPERLATRLQAFFDLALRPPPVALPEIHIDLIWHEGRRQDPMLEWVRETWHAAVPSRRSPSS
jgi:DNA-binding transcriptional LysR family regulator